MKYYYVRLVCSFIATNCFSIHLFGVLNFSIVSKWFQSVCNVIFIVVAQKPFICHAKCPRISLYSRYTCFMLQQFSWCTWNEQIISAWNHFCIHIVVKSLWFYNYIYLYICPMLLGTSDECAGLCNSGIGAGSKGSFWIRLNRHIIRLCSTHQFKNLQVNS